jgi:hypothetical protein
MKPIRIVFLVAAALAVAFVVGFFYVVNDDEGAMVAGGALFFGRLSDGKVDEAYDTADNALRVALERDELHLLAEDLQRFGRFRKLIDVTALEHGKAAGWLRATAQYQQASLPIKISFARQGRTWVVAGFELDLGGAFPPGDAASLLAAAAGFNKAFAADDRGAMYGMLDASTRRRQPPSKFDADMSALHGGCGKLTVGEPSAPAPVADAPAVVESRVLCEKSGHFVLRTTWRWLRTRWRLADIAWSQA